MQAVHTFELTRPAIADFIQVIEQDGTWQMDLHEKRNLVTLFDAGMQKTADIRLPLHWEPLSQGEPLSQTIRQMASAPSVYAIILIQAGQAALAVYNDGQEMYHKVIRKYMVRKKQGKAQINYLKTKGKSRAGSRIRLANTIAFFEEINRRLNEWFLQRPIHRILYHCAPQLWGMFFASKIQPPFDKKDERLLKIPIDVKQPNLQEVRRIQQQSTKCIVKIYHHAYIEPIQKLVDQKKQGKGL